jgi:short-subunit dehydrogenase
VELKEKGITAVDVIIANAAINLSHDVKFIDIDVDHQDEIFRINVRRIFLLTFSGVLIG